MNQETRVAQLKRWIEQVMHLAGPDNLLDSAEGEAIVVDKDHAGLPGDVVITAHHKSGLVQRWKRKGRGWAVSSTERPQ